MHLRCLAKHQYLNAAVAQGLRASNMFRLCDLSGAGLSPARSICRDLNWKNSTINTLVLVVR